MEETTTTTSAAVRTRRATPADADAIGAVQFASWQAAYHADAPPGWLDGFSAAERGCAWRERLSAARAPTVVVAETGDRVVGFAALAVPARDADAEQDTAEITTLYVDPAHWRIGAGTAVMDAALAELAGARARAVTLWVLETNERARAFYAAAGFVADGARQSAGDGWPPEIRMRRDVPGGAARSSGIMETPHGTRATPPR